MLNKRYTSNEIAENINENQFISVPGTKLFNEDYINMWLNEMAKASSLNINPTLLLNKYPWWFNENNGTMVLDKDFKEFKKKNGQFVIDKNNKKETRNVNQSYKEEVLKAIALFSANPPENFDQIRDRHFLPPDGIPTRHTILTTKTRLIVGLSGSASIFEVGITLHPYYGFPVIPGSAIKGVTRHFCEEFKTGEVDQPKFLNIFGGKDQKGKNTEGDVVFYDAWPEEWPSRSGKKLPLLELDIINPHYKEYYKEKNPKLPADNQDPNPIKFLIVRKGIKFRFAMRSSVKNKNNTLPPLALNLLKEALTTVGIGAKTGSSYGYFR
jgi:CRISPR-associated protein Cmr6